MCSDMKGMIRASLTRIYHCISKMYPMIDWAKMDWLSSISFHRLTPYSAPGILPSHFPANKSSSGKPATKTNYDRQAKFDLVVVLLSYAHFPIPVPVTSFPIVTQKSRRLFFLPKISKYRPALNIARHAGHWYFCDLSAQAILLFVHKIVASTIECKAGLVVLCSLPSGTSPSIKW